ncbi:MULTISPECIES: hypothetical protein [Pseudothermotoga]|uniref:Uncharacterized protein n=1 Tax=Pseudothermotoga lettingae (strain ATCC BAA-301 / DSM 14385 / NBRC 107922 / TMO) TaxID=416591 RepID=A8F3D5_PSELT|nr:MULTISPECIES: hypothetical protein [Pseudothermotoga]ABV32669.1 hypothetical protein Tlet_0098 [Pseudothermotoga lettingae TMO]MDK2885069.1 hypothetical protein [Pseudothermotoga sp.]MDN5338558.1 hypothetical protein [Thermotogaceae bacterium]GLI48338.1 hypothetical protein PLETTINGATMO_05070 [Pseudothermotoga lettingae TMO]
MNKELLELKLEIDSLIIGERVKGGIFRPCQDTIPSSTIEGALKHHFGVEIPAVGFFEENTYEFDEFTYSVRDKFLNISKMPIITTYLRPKNDKIKAKVYIPLYKGDNLKDELKDTEFQLGALKSKGFGKSKIVEVKKIESGIKQGILKVKVFEEEAKDFGIELISSVYGYLFKPDSFSIGGTYKRALFPGSLVKAPEVLLKEVTYYDE